jgi:phage terminase large subunit
MVDNPVPRVRKFWEFFQNNPNVEEYVLYGGSGGAKSHSTCQWLVQLLFTLQDIQFLVTRKTRPALKATTWRMMLEVLETDGYVEDEDYTLNRGDLEIRVSKNAMRFTGLDDPQKLKSSSYNYAYIEEITEFSSEDVFFIENTLRRPRSDGRLNQLFMTFNPVSATHWVWKEKVIKRNPAKTALIHSVHWDNPFLPQSYRDKLEGLISKNENLYNVYTLGMPGVLGNLIYQNWGEISSQVYNDIPDDNLSYGMDFGYNNPAALLEIKVADEEVYIRELLYETHLDDLEQVARVKNLIPLKYRNRTIYCDSAYPGRIKALKGAGLQAVPSDKDVIEGINHVKTLKLHFDCNSVNCISEIQSYEYMKKGEDILEEPVDFRNHAMDSLRYNLYTRRPSTSKPYKQDQIKAALNPNVKPLVFKTVRKS